MNIYVDNLSYKITDSYEITDESLESTFATYGEVTSARVIVDRFSGRSRGFGFVEMANNDEAEAAITGLSGKDVQGRALTVNEARPKEDRGGGASERSW